MTKIKYATTLFLIILFSEMILPNPQDYKFRRIGVEDGLSQSTVFASLQDKIGFMWFGTASGLNKYDGYSLTIYSNDPNDSSSISDDGIISLLEDSRGTIWIGTIEGNINKYDRLSDSFSHISISNLFEKEPGFGADYYDYPIAFSRNQNSTITSMIEDSDGNIWVGTWGNGIVVIDKELNKINHFYYDGSDKNLLPINRVSKLLLDENETIWIGTFGGGLCKSLKDKNGNYTFITYSYSASNLNGLTDNRIITLLIDSEFNLWIGSYNGGLNFLKREDKNKAPNKTKFTKYKLDTGKNSISNNTVMALCEDKLGNIWIGTFGGGLDKYDPVSRKFLNFKYSPTNQNSLADNDVLSLSVDKSGIIWAGSHLGAGVTVIQFCRAKFNLYSHQADNPNSLSDNVVWSIYEDKDKILWVGTYRGGITKIDRTKNLFTHLLHYQNNNNSISSNHIRAISEDKFGNLWVGTYSEGLNIIEKTSLKVRRLLSDLSINGTLSANQVQSILIDDDEYWIGTFGNGLNYFKSSDNPFYEKINFQYYTNDPTNPGSLSDNRVYKVFQDSKGIIWVGTFGGGLNKLNKSNGTFEHFRHNPFNDESISDDKVLSISEDSEGYLWIGTYGGALNKFDPSTGKFKRFSQKDGLTSGAVYGILEDDYKNLWLSTDNGIFRLNYETQKFRRYDILDGVQSREFSGGSYFKSSGGELFFGGINGLNYFYPDSIKNNPYLPPVVITSIKIMNENIKGNPSELLLNYKNNFITFEFASMDFSDPMDNNYYFILEGFDDEWQQTVAERRVANYTNLPAGSYTFRVRGSNSDGVWSTEEASISIIISPPFWNRWWFFAISAISIGFFVYYISTLRVKNLLAIEKLKTKIAADLHDNVGSGLTEISILSELAAIKTNSKNAESNKELEIISELSRTLVDNMSDIVWVVNPQRDSLHDLIVRLKNSYSDALNSLGISFRVSNLEKLKDIKLPIDFKQNLYLILKEAINNAIKHSKCSVIQLDANARQDFIEVSVTDDGIGLNEDNIELGNGIKNIKQRAESIGGRVKWKSSPNHGTSLRFMGRRSGLTKFKSFFKY